MLTSVDCDLDLDHHAIWHECSSIPTPPPCLATDSDNPRQILLNEDEPAGYEASRSSSIECFFHPTSDKPSPFKWTVQILYPCLLRLATCSSTCQRSLSLKKCNGESFDLFNLTGNLARLQESIYSSYPELRRPRGISVGYADSC